ncbi:Aldolase-type TIM barrel [Penicillium sp. IBT 31633x]|nr:Aldolase-type TIM barrel [Penicillium sp. IBT 31633x]
MSLSHIAPLSQPITLKLSGKVIRNRLYRTPLSEYASTYDENNVENCGKPMDRYAELYQGAHNFKVNSTCMGDTNCYTELAEGGAGLICTGNIPIHRDNLENYNNAVLDPNNPWDPVAAFAPAVKAAKSRGAIFLPQLQFPGRQVPEFLNKNPKSSSDQQLEPCLNKTYGMPSPLTKAEIKDLVSRYVWASEVLAKAGADGIILHASHGYIMNQFLSPKINKRTDEYGGSLENRARFILEIVNAIKAKLPSDKFVIAAKLNCHDFIEGGQSFAEQCVVIKWLEEAGVDFFDISGGTYASPAWRGNIMTELAERPSQKERGSYFIEWAQELKKVLSRAVIGTTGGWRDSHRMSEAVERGDIDMCGLGRPLREDPDFVNKVLRGEVRRSNL